MVKIDLSRDSLFDEAGLTRLKESYMREDETSPQERFAFVANAFGSNPDHAQRLYDYMSKHWLSCSTPVLSFGRTKKGLPISCFLPYLHDTSEGLIDTQSEVNWLSMLGGGIGIGVGIRASDEKSTGVMAHLRTYDAASLAFRQGTTRRGSYATYLDISHPDIIPFLDMRKATGEPRLRCANLHHGINIPDSFMKLVEANMTDPNANDAWPLIDPHSKQIKDIVSVRHLWQKICELRTETGEPYLHFIDTSNKHLPQFLKDHGLSIKQSNLCTEIFLPTDKDRTAVCCLSSLNLEWFDEWENNLLFIHDVCMFLDNVLTYFIDNAPDTIKRARYSAYRERSIGVGALGFHAYLQQKNVPFESAIAKVYNKKIFKKIQEECNAANLALGAERGEAPDAAGTGRRFSLTQAIAPNASSSIIMGNTSPSIEPFKANVYRQDTLSGMSFNRYRYLDAMIKEACEMDKSLDYDEIWSSIISNKGSAQHLEFLSDQSKMVFKTALEIDQRWIIEHAADRQVFIDQGQSVNLFFPPNVDIKYLHLVHFLAWKKGLKSLYYCRSEKIGEADKVSQQIERQRIEEIKLDDQESYASCLPCEG